MASNHDVGVVGVVIDLLVTTNMSRTQRCITKLETLTWSMMTMSLMDTVLMVTRMVSRLGSTMTGT